MKIVLVSLNYSPELTGIGKYNTEMVEWLIAKGHTVTVVTAQPYYPDWKIFKGYSPYKYTIEKTGELTVLRCPLYVPAKPTGMKRLIHLFSFAVTSFPAILRYSSEKPDIVMLTEPPFVCAPSVLFFSWLYKLPAWLHVQDFEVDAAFSMGLLHSTRLRNIILSIERWLMGKFDRISTISHRMIAGLTAKSVSAERQVYFPNWVDTSQIYPANRENSFYKKLDIPDDTIIALYSGNMGNKQGLDIIITAARELQSSCKILFVMCGNGSECQRLKNISADIRNILWLPLQPVDLLNELLNFADIHLLPQSKGVSDIVMPSKLTGILASGRPVIATSDQDTELAKIVHGKGIVTEPGNVKDFIVAIQELACSKQMRDTLGSAAREYAVNTLDYNVVMKILESNLLTTIR